MVGKIIVDSFASSENIEGVLALSIGEKVQLINASHTENGVLVFHPKYGLIHVPYGVIDWQGGASRALGRIMRVLLDIPVFEQQKGQP